jgi:hypothetical protein
VDLVVFLLATSIGLASLFAFVRYRPSAQVKRALKRLAATPIADAREGEIVKIVGTVGYAGQTVESPMSRRTCAFYSIVVEKSNRTPAIEILREERGVDFHVRDASGVALVRIGNVPPTTALVFERTRFTTPVDSDADIERILAAHGQAIRGVVFYKSLRAREGLLVEGAKIAVGGLARWMPDPDAAGGNYRETPKRLVLQASEALPLFLSDDPSAL